MAFVFVVAGDAGVEGVLAVAVAPTVSHDQKFCGGGSMRRLDVALPWD